MSQRMPTGGKMIAKTIAHIIIVEFFMLKPLLSHRIICNVFDYANCVKKIFCRFDINIDTAIIAIRLNALNNLPRTHEMV